MEILNKLHEMGITISMVDNNLRFVPKDKITPELIEEINKHKTEIAASLKDAKLLQNMPLETFIKTDLVVRVASNVLGEDILFVSDSEIAEGLKAEGFVIYTADELKAIVKLNPDPETLKVIHEVKNVFLGSVMQ